MLCYGSTAIIILYVLLVWGSTLDAIQVSNELSQRITQHDKQWQFTCRKTLCVGPPFRSPPLHKYLSWIVWDPLQPPPPPPISPCAGSAPDMNYNCRSQNKLRNRSKFIGRFSLYVYLMIPYSVLLYSALNCSKARSVLYCLWSCTL